MMADEEEKVCLKRCNKNNNISDVEDDANDSDFEEYNSRRKRKRF